MRENHTLGVNILGPLQASSRTYIFNPSYLTWIIMIDYLGLKADTPHNGSQHRELA